MNIHDIRRQNLRALVGDGKGATTHFAERVGKDRSQISQLLSDKNMGSNVARDIEEALGLPEGWMDNLQVRDTDVPPIYAAPPPSEPTLSAEQREILELHRRMPKRHRAAWREAGRALAQPVVKKDTNDCK